MLHTDRCPSGSFSPDLAEDLDVEIDLEVMVRAHRRAHRRPALDAITELVLRAQLCPDELRRTREWEHRRN